jgi:hypothetical protein
MNYSAEVIAILAVLRRRASSAYASSIDDRLDREARNVYRAVGAELEEAIAEIKDEALRIKK